MKKVATVSIISLASIQFSHADIYSDCTEKAGAMNNTVVMECSSIASSHYKKRINKSYNRLYKLLKEESPEDAKKLEESQIAWIKYRNSHCELAGRYIGSPMYGYCPMQLNKQRAEELEEF